MFRILCVEDNDDNIALLQAWLGLEADIEFIVATDGAQAVRCAIQDAPHLVLMDLSLPVMDGFQAIRLIKANPGSRHVPIIALSAHAMSEDLAKAYEAGCDDFETKPIVFTRLLAKIRQLLAGRLP
jgi:two-component system, cell cycle response regulator DivK